MRRYPIYIFDILRRGEKKKEPNLSDLALSLCCLGRIRTLTGGTRIRRATITPQGSVARGYFPFASAKLQRFFYSAKFFGTFFKKISQALVWAFLACFLRYFTSSFEVMMKFFDLMNNIIGEKSAKFAKLNSFISLCCVLL